MKLYGLFSKAKNCYMDFRFSFNEGGEFCNEISCELSGYIRGDCLWVTLNKEVADKICEKGSTEWYNSSYESPEWSEIRYGKLEVRCLNDVEL